MLHLPGRVRRVWAEGRTDADTHFGGFEKRAAVLKEAGVYLTDRRVLDVGCGDRAGVSLLCAGEGALVDAIDLLPVRLGIRRPVMWLNTARLFGLRASIKQIARDHLHTWRYWRQLRRLSRKPLPSGSIRFHRMDAGRMAFESNTFDVVFSSAVWEHLSGVEAATREVNRVLKPDGIGWIEIALFPGIQGGHHAEWHDPSPGIQRTVRPWDHLRQGGRPLPLYCNGWSEAQYRDVFERETSIQRWEDGEFRGESYLTPAIREELLKYSERDLLLSSVTVWIRKKQ